MKLVYTLEQDARGSGLRIKSNRLVEDTAATSHSHLTYSMRLPRIAARLPFQITSRFGANRHVDGPVLLSGVHYSEEEGYGMRHTSYLVPWAIVLPTRDTEHLLKEDLRGRTEDNDCAFLVQMKGLPTRHRWKGEAISWFMLHQLAPESHSEEAFGDGRFDIVPGIGRLREYICKVNDEDMEPNSY